MTCPHDGKASSRQEPATVTIRTCLMCGLDVEWDFISTFAAPAEGLGRALAMLQRELDAEPLSAAPEFYEDGQRIMPDDKPAAPAEGMPEAILEGVAAMVATRLALIGAEVEKLSDDEIDAEIRAYRRERSQRAEGLVYLPMDCPLCGRRRVEWDGTTMKCEKCGTSSEWDGFDKPPAPAEGLRDAAQAVVILTDDLARWDELNHYVVNSDRDYLAGNLSAAWDRLRAALTPEDDR